MMTANLVVRAARLASTLALAEGALALTKKSACAAGIGGGSADAAATLHLLSGRTGGFARTPMYRPAWGRMCPVCLYDNGPSGWRGSARF